MELKALSFLCHTAAAAAAQVFDAYDEEVQDAEAAEAPSGRQEKDSELKPFFQADRWGVHGRQGVHAWERKRMDMRAPWEGRGHQRRESKREREGK